MVRRDMQHATQYNSPPTAHLVTTPLSEVSRNLFPKPSSKKDRKRERRRRDVWTERQEKAPLSPSASFFLLSDGWIERQVEGSAAKRPPGSAGGRTAFTKPNHEKMRERELSSNLRIHEST